MHESQKLLFLVMEVAKAGSLHAFIEYRKLKNQPITDLEASCIVKQILEGVKYIHSIDIIHRDLKPQNVLLKSFQKLDGAVKIADLGLGTKLTTLHSLIAERVCGTLIYMAPETILKQGCGKVLYLQVP